MDERDEREQMAREREGRIPAEIVSEAHSNVHIRAATHRYIRGDAGAWEDALGMMREDCARLTEAVERGRMAVTTLPVGPWPRGAAAPGEAMTGAQCVALLHAAETQRLLFGLACRIATRDAPTAFVVPRS